MLNTGIFEALNTVRTEHAACSVRGTSGERIHSHNHSHSHSHSSKTQTPPSQGDEVSGTLTLRPYQTLAVRNLRRSLAGGILAEMYERLFVASQTIARQGLPEAEVRNTGMREFYSQLLKGAEEKSDRPGWAANKLREHFGVWPCGLRDIPSAVRKEVMNFLKQRQIRNSMARHGQYADA